MIPQYHMVSNDEFNMVPYLDSNKEPLNWQQLVADSLETIMDEEYELTQTWLQNKYPKKDDSNS